MQTRPEPVGYDMVIILLGIFYRTDGAKPKFVQAPGSEMNNIAVR